MAAPVHLEEPLKTTEGCRFCWMCRHVCPVGHVTHRETLTPHAWALTIDAVRRGTLKWNDDSADVLYACADCGMCRTHCVTDQPLPDAIAAARADVAASGLAPRAVYALHETLQRWGNPYGEHAAAADGAGSETADGRSGSAAAKIPGGSPLASRQAAALRGRSLAGEGAAPVRGEVALFVGDAAAHLGRDTLEAALALLAAADIDVTPIASGRSTGLLASSLGFPDTAAAQARAVLADVAAAGCRELLVIAPGDRYAFERMYRERLNLDWPADVAVRDVTSVLAAAYIEGKIAFHQRPAADSTPYAYHDPCHAPRTTRDADAPRMLLRAALGDPESRMFWRERRAHPCGAIGGLEFTQPAIAAQLADARLADAASAGARWLITDDPACLHHLRGRKAAGIDLRGFYELLVEQLDR